MGEVAAKQTERASPLPSVAGHYLLRHIELPAVSAEWPGTPVPLPLGEVAAQQTERVQPSISSYPSGAVRPRSSQTALLYFLVTSVYSMGMVEMSASPFRILTAISPVV